MVYCRGGIPLHAWYDSSDSSSEEPISSDESEGDKRPSVADEKVAPDTTGCALQDLLRDRIQSEALGALIDAHLRLDDLRICRIASDGLWKQVALVLKEYGDRSRFLSDAKREFRRRNVPFPGPIIIRSLERLEARLDLMFGDESSQSVRSRTHTDVLTSSDHKALNVCVQLWRKAFRGSAEAYAAPANDRWKTCFELSVAAMSDNDSAKLVLCTNGIESLPSQLNTLQARSDRTRWTSLHICCHSIAQWKRVASDIKPGMAFKELHIQPHALSTTTRQLWSTLPPSLCHTNVRTIAGLNHGFRNADATVNGNDVRSKLDRYRQFDFVRGITEPQSLAAAAIAVIRRHRRCLNMNVLPPHLLTAVKESYFCTSCDRLITPPDPWRKANKSAGQFQFAALEAGFRLSDSQLLRLDASLKRNSLWLPWFTEMAVTAYPDVDTIRIGGYQAWEDGTPSTTADENTESEDDERTMSWRFCAPCAADHLRVRREGGGVECMCVLCKRRRSHMQSGKTEDQEPLWTRLFEYSPHVG